MGYEIRITEGRAFGMTDLKMIDLWTGEVVFVENDGKATHAINVTSYNRTELGKRRIRTKLNEQRRRLEHHYKTTGKRWELERRAEYEATQAAKKAARLEREAMRNAAPEMLAALRAAEAALQRDCPL